MLRYWTAGESHGPALLALVDGFPAGLAVDLPAIDAELTVKPTISENSASSATR